ncbi:MAG TPA: right-handed parallel beta-helix repeat-containing protein [Armatimonadota bacterium]|jgi:hypothetical protein
MKLAVAAALALSAVSASWSSVLYVSHQVEPPSPDGLSWATAFPTVQQGIDAAQAGDEVWVAAGTYPENITLKSGVGLYGGFVGNEESRDPRDPSVNISLLDGQSKGTVIIIAADATSATVVDGFDIEHGYGLIATSDGRGGGIYVKGGTPIISNNVITNCSAQSSRTSASLGGGIYVDDGKPLIAGNRISYCYATTGGGVGNWGGGLIRDNVFSHNGAIGSDPGSGEGGAIEAWGLLATVMVHNIFEGNSSYGGYGGAINCANGVVMDNLFIDNPAFEGASLYSAWVGTIVRNTFLDDTGPDSYYEVLFGGGVFKDNVIAVSGVSVGLDLGRTWNGSAGGAEPVISNNTIVQLGSGEPVAVTFSFHSGEKPVFSNNIITGWANAGWMNTLSTGAVMTTDHNDIFGNGDNTLPFPGATQIGAAGNISLAPLFVDGAGGDYRLQAGSPCIDAGNDAYIASDARDLANAPRIAGAHVDIGAYENGSPAYTMLDAAEVLRIAAGISVSTPANVSRLDLVQETPGTTALTVADATRIAQWLLN